ncbi:DUF167 domain-containing protein [Candidatus Berkelbacteria bacterium]|nr:DUF167 domain-containing protein [Candidatus Berkelbacteria bacterium]
MKLTVRVKPNSRFTSVEELEDGSYRVAVTVPPERGKANGAVIDALATHFDVPKSSVEILAGHAVRTKIIEIVGQPQS